MGTWAGLNGDARVELDCGCTIEVDFEYECTEYCGQHAELLQHRGGKMVFTCANHGWHTTPEAYAEREEAAFAAKRAAELAQSAAEFKLGNYESALARIAYLESTIKDMRAALKAANGRMS